LIGIGSCAGGANKNALAPGYPVDSNSGTRACICHTPVVPPWLTAHLAAHSILINHIVNQVTGLRGSSGANY